MPISACCIKGGLYASDVGLAVVHVYQNYIQVLYLAKEEKISIDY